jgi:hypothetical protein
MTRPHSAALFKVAYFPVFALLALSCLQPKISVHGFSVSSHRVSSLTVGRQLTPNSSWIPYYSNRLDASPQISSSTPSVFSPSQENIQLAERLDVQPARLDVYPPWFWRLCWRLHGRLLPILHAFDRARTRDLENCLKCLWCKAVNGLNPKSPAFDSRLAYDMLPSITRWAARFPFQFYPPLVHYIIELRTVFLNCALQEEIQRIHDDDQDCKIRLITLGAGYDTRSVKFLNEDGTARLDDAWELDMQPVIKSKSVMLERLQIRRPSERLPSLVEQDLRDLKGLEKNLDQIMTTDQTKVDSNLGRWHTIFLVEGVLIYLKEEQRSNLLSFCSSYLQRRKESESNGSFLFADRIRRPRDTNLEQIKGWLQMDGWELVDNSFCVHPGKARHMGVARIARARE